MAFAQLGGAKSQLRLLLTIVTKKAEPQMTAVMLWAFVDFR